VHSAARSREQLTGFWLAPGETPGDDSANPSFGRLCVRANVLRLLYLTAIAVVMIGWVWLLVEAIAKAID
jgi:hypothetical protein